MSVEQQLTSRLKEAMRARNTREVDVLRMVKAMATKEKVAPGFEGETDDAFWLGVIGRYVKQQKKALAEFEKLGDAAATQAEEARFEIDYLTPFLPQLLGEEAVQKLVEEAIAATGAVGEKMVGKVIGHVMRSHRDEVDPQLVRRIATEALG
jgi:uncharacterized protein YqeY